MFEVKSLKIGDPSKVQGNAKDTIDKVLETLADKQTKWLVDLTHLESPWIDARKGLDSADRGNAIISPESIFNYYSSL